jgi:YVTN family beta-propeller protein
LTSTPIVGLWRETHARGYNQSFSMLNNFLQPREHRIRQAGILLGTIAMAVLVSMLAGCGDTYRQIVFPVPNPGGDPVSSDTRNQAVMISAGLSSGTCPDGTAAPCQGAATLIDVPGDTISKVLAVGRQPLSGGLLFGGAQVWTLNVADKSASVFTTYVSSTVSTATLPDTSAPNFLFSNQADSVFITDPGQNAVLVVSRTTDALSNTIPLGAGDAGPVMLTQAAGKVYVVNNTSGTVTVISGTNKTVLSSVTVGASPIWAVPSFDGTAVYVLNHSAPNAPSTVSVIDTATDSVVATMNVGHTNAITRPGDVPMAFDGKLTRLYVLNGADSTLTVFDATTPQQLVVVNQSVPLSAGASNPVALTVLRDGSKVYTVNEGSSDVSIINATTFGATKIPSCSTASGTSNCIGPNPVSIASSYDSSRVYVVVPNPTPQAGGSADLPPGMLSIKTATDSVVTNFPAPQQDFNCVASSTVTCARETPLFVSTINQ